MRKALLKKGVLTLQPFALPVGALLSLWLFSSAQALIAGIFIALVVGHNYASHIKLLTPKLLAIAIIGLGFGMDLKTVVHAGTKGLPYTVAGLIFTFLLGSLIGKLLKTSTNTSTLLSVGTGICGGSAIAAVSSVIKADHQDTAVALGIVFSLNALALVIFPPLGAYFGLNDEQFGLWCALAIHDTSSVLGASMQFGEKALAVAMPVKLARALWIFPIVLAFGFIYRDRSTPKMPWFIFGFVLASSIITLAPALMPLSTVVNAICKKLMHLTLFLIGASLTRENLKSIGPTPFFHGSLLWMIMAVITLIVIKSGA